MVSGLPNEAICQEDGIPFWFSTLSSDMARTSDETPIIVNVINEIQATIRAAAQRRCFISFCLIFSRGII